MAAKSDSKTRETQAGAATRGASAGSTSETTGTAAGDVQSGAGAQGRLAQIETLADIGQGEAYILQLKRIIANELSHDATLQAQERQTSQAAASAMQNLTMVASSSAADLIKAGSSAVISEIHKTMRTSLHEVDDLTNMGDELERVVVAKLASLLGVAATQE